MIGAPSRQPAIETGWCRHALAWDDGVVGLLQADSNLTTLMSGSFIV
jgi:hypothetical protein